VLWKLSTRRSSASWRYSAARSLSSLSVRSSYWLNWYGDSWACAFKSIMVKSPDYNCGAWCRDPRRGPPPPAPRHPPAC